MKEVKKTSKRVRIFETQKIVKKLKDARWALILNFYWICHTNFFRRKGNDEENTKSLEAQLDYIKAREYCYMSKGVGTLIYA